MCGGLDGGADQRGDAAQPIAGDARPRCVSSLRGGQSSWRALRLSLRGPAGYELPAAFALAVASYLSVYPALLLLLCAWPPAAAAWVGSRLARHPPGHWEEI